MTEANNIQEKRRINKQGALKLSSVALWNQHFLAADKLVTRALRYNGIKPIGVLLEGQTGTGKSHFAKKKKEELNMGAVDKGDYTTMPVVMVDAPKDSRKKSMIQRLLYQLGDIKPTTGIEDEQEARLLRLLEVLEVKLIIIDEIHDFFPKNNRNSKSGALAWLKGLMDNSLIPILFIGTEEARVMRTLDIELGDRIPYSVTISKLPYGTTNNQKFDFAEMATAFAENLPNHLKKLEFVTFSEGEAKYSNIDILDRLYVATNGLPRGLRDIFFEINLEMEDSPKFTPTLDELSNICKRLITINENTNFDPFGRSNLDKVRKIIGYTKTGEINEAA